MTARLRSPVAMGVAALVAMAATLVAARSGAGSGQASAAAPALHGWVSLFDGSSLDGWDGRRDVWKVDDGAITGEVAHGPSSVTDTTYIVWKGGEVADFELRAEIRTEGRFVNSGVLYRAFVVSAPASGRGNTNAPYKLGGPQLDFDAAGRYAGQYFDVASERLLLVRPGQVVEQRDQAEVIGSVGDPAALGRLVRLGEWNHLRVIAQGSTMIHLVNGAVTTVLVDRDPVRFRPRGLLALQLEGAGRVRFRNILLKVG
jgi:Domain of Unknown Function (DUF1080)